MFSYKLISACMPLLLASTLASPLRPGFEAKLAEHATLQPRQSEGSMEWSSPDGSGNFVFYFSDTTVNYGQTNPIDIINNNVSVSCADAGACLADSVDWGNANYANGDGLSQEDISYTASGNYPSWVHNGLISALTYFMQNQTTVNNNCYVPPTGCGSYEAYCPPLDPVCADEYTAPTALLAVLVGDSWNAGSNPGYMQVEFTVTKETNGGLCATLAAIGSAIAGAIPEAGGPLAGVFALAGLGCAA